MEPLPYWPLTDPLIKTNSACTAAAHQITEKAHKMTAKSNLWLNMDSIRGKTIYPHRKLNRFCRKKYKSH